MHEEYELSSLTKVAEGAERVVYISETHPHLVFKRQKKVIERQLKPKALKSFLLKNVKGFEHYIVRKEYEAYVKMCLEIPNIFDFMPVAKVHGFVGSDRGTLQVCQKVSLDGKNIGPTLKQLIQASEFSQHDFTILNRFVHRLLLAQLPTNDVNANNIVKGLSPKGSEEFYLIDGIGDIHVIPIRTFSAKARKSHLSRVFTKFSDLGLFFDRDDFCFYSEKSDFNEVPKY